MTTTHAMVQAEKDRREEVCTAITCDVLGGGARWRRHDVRVGRLVCTTSRSSSPTGAARLLRSPPSRTSPPRRRGRRLRGAIGATQRSSSRPGSSAFETVGATSSGGNRQQGSGPECSNRLSEPWGGTDLELPCNDAVSELRGMRRGMPRPYTSQELGAVDLAVVHEDVRVAVGRHGQVPLPDALPDLGP